MQPDEQLRPAFLSQLQGLQSRVYTLAPPKVLQGRELSGANLASLARSYASQINGGAIPTMTDMFEHMAASQCKQSKADAWAQFEKDMAAIADAIPLSAEVRYAPSVVPLLLACWSMALHTRRCAGCCRSWQNASCRCEMLPFRPSVTARSEAQRRLHRKRRCGYDLVGQHQPPVVMAIRTSHCVLCRLQKSIAESVAAVRSSNEAKSTAVCTRKVEDLWDEIMRPLISDITVPVFPDHAQFGLTLSQLSQQYTAGAVGPASGSVFADQMCAKLPAVIRAVGDSRNEVARRRVRLRRVGPLWAVGCLSCAWLT